jgi:hypothetical protein
LAATRPSRGVAEQFGHRLLMRDRARPAGSDPFPVFPESSRSGSCLVWVSIGNGLGRVSSHGTKVSLAPVAAWEPSQKAGWHSSLAPQWREFTAGIRGARRPGTLPAPGRNRSRCWVYRRLGGPESPRCECGPGRVGPPPTAHPDHHPAASPVRCMTPAATCAHSPSESTRSSGAVRTEQCHRLVKALEGKRCYRLSQRPHQATQIR